ncbi:ABC transporter permease [Paenibacillus sp.]|uniref:ABC transporter permease n=1 Tax=Paenibacillus sp. TaxID=58172 RepID=UPI0028111A26|nr:ABC transporter permease [Paenibacillus sp.]
MLAILKVQLQQMKRNPATMLLMIVMTVLFTVAMGANAVTSVPVYAFPDPALSADDAEAWLERLNRSETFEFVLEAESEAKERVTEGKAEFALRLLPDDYRIVAAVDNSANLQALAHYVRTVYEEELTIRAAEASSGGSSIRVELEERLAAPALRVASSEVATEEDFKYDARVQALFGFALFFSIFTVAYSVNALLEEKRSGVWDRVILSPVTKISMYVGHLVNSFIAGYVQIAVVFVLFRYVFDFPVGDSFATLLVLIGVYTFAVVALGLLLAGLVQTPQQMSVLIPIVAVSSAMIGGAYWPIEIVTNPALLALAKVIPVTYGMEALKGVAYYGYTWSELLRPVSYMLLIGVACMGVGINLIERRRRG